MYLALYLYRFKNFLASISRKQELRWDIILRVSLWVVILTHKSQLPKKAVKNRLRGNFVIQRTGRADNASGFVMVILSKFRGHFDDLCPRQVFVDFDQQYFFICHNWPSSHFPCLDMTHRRPLYGKTITIGIWRTVMPLQFPKSHKKPWGYAWNFKCGRF